MGRWTSREGSPRPLGAAYVEEEKAFNFALHSRHAEKVTLLFFKRGECARPALKYPLNYLRNKTRDVWHCRLPASVLRGIEYYAYSVVGPKPEGRFAWHAFDPHKHLLDPYARAIHFPPHFSRRAAMRAGSNGGKAPLGVLRPSPRAFDWSGDRRPDHEEDLIIYELHVRGFTRHKSSGLSTSRRGTYLGLVEKIPYLESLGITAVELMPVFQYDPQEKNFWGYMPISFFAPHAGYAASRSPSNQIDEFREMVKALHAADIEVILDVVYNHTGEGNGAGPTYSFRGIDNSSYYLMTGVESDPYVNISGTGNTFFAASRPGRRVILDSMRYWVEEMHVDGFRFDLASALARKADGTLDGVDPALFGEIESDPVLRNVRLVGEPWDAGGAYQLGVTFPGTHWLQWNDRFRDDIRRFVRGDPDHVPKIMARLYGSSDVFPEDRVHSCRPRQSVNYVASHDGFTLYDLLSYNEKHNEANGHDNSDGPNDEHSWNCGREGDSEATPELLGLRKRQARNFFALLMLANGTPMFRAGDEFLQTQGGNNNPFNQDNETSWLDWRRAERFDDVQRFFREMIALRKRHPSICRSSFWRGDVRWYGVQREVDLTYHSRSLAYCLHGASVGDKDLYVMVNSYSEPLTFRIQEGAPRRWKRIADTSLPAPADIVDEDSAPPLESGSVVVDKRSVVVLVSR